MIHNYVIFKIIFRTDRNTFINDICIMFVLKIVFWFNRKITIPITNERVSDMGRNKIKYICLVFMLQYDVLIIIKDNKKQAYSNKYNKIIIYKIIKF